MINQLGQNLSLNLNSTKVCLFYAKICQLTFVYFLLFKGKLLLSKRRHTNDIYFYM